MATKKTAGDMKQAKAVKVLTAEQAKEQFEELMNSVNREKWLNVTKNGTLKLTVSRPELSEDNKGSLIVGGTEFFLVSAGTSKTSLLISFRSYLIYTLKLKALTEKLANFPTFEDWAKKQTSDWAKFEAVGIVLSDEQKRQMYDNAKAKLGTISEDGDDDE